MSVPSKQFTASLDSLPAELPRPQIVGYLLTTPAVEITLPMQGLKETAT